MEETKEKIEEEKMKERWDELKKKESLLKEACDFLRVEPKDL